MRARLLLTILASTSMLILAGCGSSTKTVPVSGVVTLDGEPLADARVTFNPLSEGGWMAFGQTDATGRFSLQTQSGKEGALPGEYKVTITVTGAVKEADPNLVKDVKKMMEERDRLSKLKRKDVHPNYKTVDKSVLRQVVPSDGEVRLALTKDGK